MDISDEELMRAAAAGDTRSAALYLRRQLPFLRAMATRIAAPSMDAEDLLSEALLRLTKKWREGTGPQAFAHTYVIQTMRNLVIDEARSARARTSAVSDEVLELVPDEYAERRIRDVDAYDEFALIQQSLELLPEDQRRVLIGVVVNGMKPGEIAEEWGRAPAAVSNLLQRAKGSMRRAVLVILLGRGEFECAQNADRIPRVPLPEPDDHDATERGMRHVLGCEDCRRKWSRWAKMSSARGFLPLLFLAQLARPAPASALQNEGDSGRLDPARSDSAVPSSAMLTGVGAQTEASSAGVGARAGAPEAGVLPPAGSSAGTSAGTSVGTPAAGTGTAASTSEAGVGAQAALVVVPPAATLAGAALPRGADERAAGAAAETSDPVRATGWLRRACGRILRWIRLRPILASGIGLAAIGAVLLGVGLGGWFVPQKPPASIAVTMPDRAHLTIGFDVRAETWRAERVEITLTGARIVSTPAGWSCTTGPSTTVCDPGAGRVSGTVTVSAGDGPVGYHVRVSARAESFTLTGTGDGTHP